MSYSKDMRERAIAYRSAGHTLEETREVFQVSVSTIREWEKRLAETGTLDPTVTKRKHKKIDPEKLAKYVEEHQDAYLRELAEEFSCSDTAICKALDRLNITRKKRRRAIESKTPQR